MEAISERDVEGHNGARLAMEKGLDLARKHPITMRQSKHIGCKHSYGAEFFDRRRCWPAVDILSL